MKRLRHYSICAAVLVLTILLTSCLDTKSVQDTSIENSIEQNEVGGKITFITNRDDLVRNGFYDEFVAQFKEKYPAVEDVNVISTNSYYSYDKDMRVKILSNDYADVLVLPSDIETKNLPEFFEPLDDLGLGDNLYFSDRKAYDGKMYGVAIGVSLDGIVYNKNAFKNAGITKLPTTLEEFYEACEKLKQAGIVPVHLSLSSGWTLSNWGAKMAPLMTGDVGTIQRMSETDEPFQVNNEIGKAYDIIRTIIQKGYVEADLYGDTWEQSKIELAKGNTAMYYHGNWAISQVLEQTDTGVKSEDLGFMPFPASNTGTSNAYLNPDIFFVVNKNSENLPTAKAWVKYLTEESNLADKSGYMPTLKTRDSSIAQFEEFNSFQPNLIESLETDDVFSSITSLSGIKIDDSGLIREIALTKDLGAKYAELNAKWRKARQEVLK